CLDADLFHDAPHRLAGNSNQLRAESEYLRCESNLASDDRKFLYPETNRQHGHAARIRRPAERLEARFVTCYVFGGFSSTGVLRSLNERYLDTVEVIGSIPVAPTGFLA